jgi:serine phosphatase RsbU (regulator of sigma subunit)
MLNSRGFPLGVLPNATYETKYTPFMNGNLLLLYSDCLIESKNETGEPISEEEIKKITKTTYNEYQQQGNPAKHIVGQLSQTLREHSGNSLSDDLTITAYFRNPKN